MALLTFYQIFKQLDDKTLLFLLKTRIGKTEFEAGETLSKGVVVAGLDFFQYIGNNMEVDKEDDGTYVIKKIYLSE